MTKQALAELISKNKGGGSDNRTKFDARDIYGYIDVVLPGLIDQVIKENGNNIDGSLLKTYENVPFKWSETRKVVYIDLPAKVHQIVGDRGLYQIQPMESETSQQFTATTSAAVPVFHHLEAGRWDNEEDYYLEGEKVIFPKMSKAKASGFVKVKLIPATSEYGESEEIKIPGRYTELLFQKVLALADPQAKMPQKETNDNNANTR